MLRVKYQPSSIGDLVGQEIVKKIFKRILEIQSQDSKAIYPTILLYGIRGLGKTISGRLFTQTINCLNKKDPYTPCHTCINCKSIKDNTNPDFVEIDAATYNGVENIRSSIIEHSKYPPIHLPYRVYLIDEVHMLTKESFNSLLKTIEYPPESVVFLLATTEIEKIPDTVRSRCLILDFQPIPSEDLTNMAQNILKKEQYIMEEGALALLVAISGGSARDLIVLLEKAILCEVHKEEECLKCFGCCSMDIVMNIYLNILLGNREEALIKWNFLQKNGCSSKFFLEALVNIIGDAISFRNSHESENVNVLYKMPKEIKSIDNNFLAKHWEIAVYMLSLEKVYYYNSNWVKLTIIFLCHMTYTVGDEKTVDYLCKMLPTGNLKSKIWNK